MWSIPGISEKSWATNCPNEASRNWKFRAFKNISWFKKALYQEIELIIFSISTAAVTVSVESIIESYASIYEYRNNKNRPIKEERAHHEMLIAVNGPELAHADNLIKSSMSKIWKNQKSNNDNWHFTLRSEDIKSYTVSKTVDRISKEIPSLPFILWNYCNYLDHYLSNHNSLKIFFICAKMCLLLVHWKGQLMFFLLFVLYYSNHSDYCFSNHNPLKYFLIFAKMCLLLNSVHVSGLKS